MERKHHHVARSVYLCELIGGKTRAGTKQDASKYLLRLLLPEKIFSPLLQFYFLALVAQRRVNGERFIRFKRRVLLHVLRAESVDEHCHSCRSSQFKSDSVSSTRPSACESRAQHIFQMANDAHISRNDSFSPQKGTRVCGIGWRAHARRVALRAPPVVAHLGRDRAKCALTTTRKAPLKYSHPKSLRLSEIH